MSRRRAAVAGVLVLGAVAAAAGTGLAAFRDTGFPAYVSPDGHWSVVSNAGWKAGAGAAKEIAPEALGIPSYDGSKPSFVWARSCPRGRQTVRFERTLRLPGPPSSLQLDVYAPGFGKGGSVQVLVNHRVAAALGSAVLAQTSTSETQIGASERASFRDGDNVVDVVAVKPAGMRSCSGVAFGLDAASQAALSVTKPTTSLRYSKDPSPMIAGPITITNGGPSAAFGGTFSFVVQTGGLDGGILQASASGGISCQPPSATSVQCTFVDLPPGASASVDVTVHLSWPSDQTSDQVMSALETWSAGAKDASLATAMATWAICGATSTNSHCR